MREQLIQYIDLLFAGHPGDEDIKQEILQNTLDRYDDLTAQGKSPAAAYSLAISSIGDISEILGSQSETKPTLPDPAAQSKPEYRSAPTWKKVLRAIAVGLYILSLTPLIALSEMGMEILGLCGFFAFIAVATVLIIIASGGKEPRTANTEPQSPRQALDQAIGSITGIVTLCIYLAVSFSTGAWWITWLVFPISAAVKGLIKACIDLKEAKEHEI